jgi:hypothetical protein
MRTIRIAFLMVAIIAAVSLGLTNDQASAAGHLRIAGVGGNYGNQAANDIGLDIPGATTDRLTTAAYNAMSPSDLRAAYDVLIFTWFSSSSLDVDWTTRIKPYIDLGGGVIFEDDTNVGQLAGIPITTKSTTHGGISVIGSVPGLTDGITDEFVNNHITFDTWPASFTPFLQTTDGSGAQTGVVGLYGGSEFGCMIVQGPDMDFHGLRGAAGAAGNQYNLLLNEIEFVTNGCESTKAGILSASGVDGKGISTAPGLDKEFNPKSKAADKAGKKK